MSIPRPTREWVEEMATYWHMNEPLGMLARAYLAQWDENEALAKALYPYYASHQGGSDGKRNDCPCFICKPARAALAEYAKRKQEGE